MMKKNNPSSKRNPISSRGSLLSKMARNIFSGDNLSDNIAPIVGLLMVAVSIYMIYSYITYFVFGSQDQSIMISQGIEPDEAIKKTVNPSGFGGASVMHLFVNGWVGISAIILLVYTFFLGFSLLKRDRMRRLRMLILSVISTFWCSLFFTTILQPWKESLFFRPGGIVGVELYEYLSGRIGLFGIILSLIVVALITGFVFFHTIRNRYRRWIMPNRELAEVPTATSSKWWHKLFRRAPKPAATPAAPISEDTSTLSTESQSVSSLPITDSEIPEEVAETSHTFVSKEDTPLTDDEINEEEDSLPYVEWKRDEAKPQTIQPQGSPQNLDIEIIDARTEDESEVYSQSPEDKASRLVAELGEYDPRLDLGQFKMPTFDLLDDRSSSDIFIDHKEVQGNKDLITDTLRQFNIGITSIKATVGPTITLYEVVPESGIKISRIRNLEHEIAMGLSAIGIRIIAPIPGKGTVGIEVPNANPQVVGMRSVIASKKFQESQYDLPIALGRTITNEVFTFDLAKIPHLLVAGATGQGKSVGLNAIITSLLYRKHPSELKFVMIDPKMVEFSIYSAMEKHYMAKLPTEKNCIITDPKRVVSTLNSLCKEMDDRYELLTKAKVRNIKEYNELFKGRRLNPANGHRFMPYLVVIIDEYGDLIMTSGKEIELPITRLAQKARAVGIHAIIATQRPTATIITGTIKANFPGRISFKVFSVIDSRTILDAAGANRLVGKGDLLYSQGSDFIRVQCAFIDTPEVNRVVDYIANQRGFAHAYELPEVSSNEGSNGDFSGGIDTDERDPLFEQVARLLVLEQQGSVSFIQRKFSIGYNRAGRLMDQLEASGIVSAPDGSKGREVLVKSEEHLNSILDQL